MANFSKQIRVPLFWTRMQYLWSQTYLACGMKRTPIMMNCRRPVRDWNSLFRDGQLPRAKETAKDSSRGAKNRAAHADKRRLLGIEADFLAKFILRASKPRGGKGRAGTLWRIMRQSPESALIL